MMCYADYIRLKPLTEMDELSFMLPWDEYFRTLVRTFRDLYERLSAEEKAIAQANMTFIKPCQIELLSLKKPNKEAMIVTFDENRADMEFTVHENIEMDPKTFLDNLALEGDPVILQYREHILQGLKGAGFSWSALGDKASVYFFRSVQEKYPDSRNFALDRFDDVLRLARDNLSSKRRSAGYKSIERMTDQLRSDVERIVDDKLRSKMLETTEKIGTSLSDVKQIDEYEKRLAVLEQDVGGVRRLIGTTTEFQDWRLLISNVEELKKDYVSKTVFEGEIKRIDQRIEDLKAIKFWSKRTVVDILLVLVTALGIIATLFAAGKLHF